MYALKKILLLGSLTISCNLYAGDLTITSDAKKAIKSLKSTDLEKHSGVYRVQYSYKIAKKFGKISNSFVKNKSDYLQLNKRNEYNGQCVSFAKAMTNKSGKLKKGRKLSKNMDIKFGTFIATFDSNGDYNNKHAAILLKIDSENRAFVLDQNWINASANNDKGTVGIHFLKFSETGNYKNDAGAYYTVKE